MAWYGAIPKGSYFGVSSVLAEYTSGATGAKNDLVNLESGVLEIASAGDELLGVLQETMASADTGVSVNITPGIVVIMDNDNDTTTFASTHVGDRFDITGGTGAQQVDTSTASGTAGSLSGQLACMAYNPQGVGFNSDTSVGKFTTAEYTYPVGG